ncbi:M81 family metallopeptidase [Paenibacillus sp. GYB004]|uniref:M81 family metallopeptidase n=1 Tax=Paenibacillus sp. GYB004 TaxID=2994393 RepID=UPI002F9680BD
MRFLIGQLMHETNTFSNVTTTEDAFRQREWAYGEAFRENHREVSSFVGGMLDEAARLAIEAVPVFGAAAVPSGIIARAAYERMKRELLLGIEAAGACDAVCLALHGAGVAEGVDDIEGDLLRAVRERIGSEVPLVVTLDLHANLTPLMVEHADLLIGNREYPHIDSYERGQEAVGLARQVAAGELRPVMHLAKPPLLIPTIGTDFEPIRSINADCREAELSSVNVLNCTFYHGFPYADVDEAGVAVLVIANGDRSLAERTAETLASRVIGYKPQFYPKPPSPEEGIELALRSEARPIVLNETSDNPGAGTPGDGTYLLRAMLGRKLPEACFAFIYDPQTAEQAHAAGVGATIDIRLGGKTDELHGAPLELRAYVKALTDGRFVTTSPMGRGARSDLGKSVRFQAEGLDFIVCSVRNQVFDEQIFLLHGIDIRTKKIVGLKSSHHFRAAFEPLCERIITVDSPGLSMFDFTGFRYERVKRPIFPLDRDVE